MGIKQALHVATVTSLVTALTLIPAATASADQVRDAQWPLKFLDAESAWEVSEGEGVTIAVIDDGFETDHPDLKENLLKGKDFIDGGDVNPSDGDNHGTAMASIIAAHGHGPGRSQGMKGLAPEAKILPIRYSLQDSLADPIRYAVDQGATVINISLGSSASDNEEKEAVEYALENDVLIVTASGNEGNSSIGYPGGYPGTLTVGATGEDGEVWENSNHGAEVLLTAPGVEVVTAGSSTPYRKGDGTSDASAYTSAAAGLIRAKYPDLTAGQVVNRLVKTAGLPDSAKGIPLPDEKYGYGYIRPLAALTEDIPEGSKYGPLKVPDSLQSPSPGAGSGDDNSSDSGAGSSNTLKRILVFVVAPVLLLLVIGLVIFAVARSSRRKKRSAPVGVGWGEGPQAQQPPYGQPMPPGNAGGFPPQQQGPNQNQPSGPWGP
ncbi:S8 family serine peptidase [Streptomyces sp. NPDC059637]|uniref:S8 family serine peptidase n=1 Tax=Streptomyces sp. NPDC059637 TaxID=3347752 RepID=UPI0036804DD7